MLLPVAAQNIEENDDEAQTVAGKVGATKEPGEDPGVMLPSRYLKNGTMTKSPNIGVEKKSLANVHQRRLLCLMIKCIATK